MGETSVTIRARVEAARQRQRERFAILETTTYGANTVVCNADMRIAEIRKFCQLDDASASLMKSAMTHMNLSARAYGSSGE